MTPGKNGAERMTTQLTTARLLLRRARADDAPALHRVFSDAETMRYWSTPPHPDLATTERWLASMLAAPADRSDDFLIEHQGEVVGKAGFYRLPEVGFILRPDLWAPGLAREAVRAVLDHVFATRDLERVEADVDPRNAGSLGLLRSLGFVETGRAARTWCIAGEWADSVYLALPRP